MSDPIRWFLRRYGPDNAKIDYSFADLGITGATQNLVNQGEDTVSLSFFGLRPPAGALFVPGEWITIFGESLPWFSGRIGAPERSAGDAQRAFTLPVHGPWYDFARLVYMAPGAYCTNPPQTGIGGIIQPQPIATRITSAVTSNVYLAKDQDSTLLDGMQTLRRALLYAQTAGAWFQIGDVPDTLKIPAEAIRDKTVADVLKACVRWDPSIFIFFDYRTLPPTLNIVPRSQLTPVNLPTGDGGNVAKVSVRARPDLIIPGVCVQYIRQFTQTPQIQIDTTGSAPVVKVAPVAAKPTTDLTGIFVPATGPGVNIGDSHFVPASGPGITVGTGVSFVPGPSPFFRPNAPTVYASDGTIVQGSGGVTTVAPPAPDAPTPPAPTVPPNVVQEAPSFDYYSIEYENAGLPFLATGETVLKLGALAFTVELSGGALDAFGYSPQELDAPPYGLAAMILAGRTTAPWEGSVSLKGRDVGFLNYVGRGINVVGGDPEWEQMAAPCQSLTRNTATGETTLNLGTLSPLGVSDISSLLKAARGFSVVKVLGAGTSQNLPPVHDPLPPPSHTGGGGGGGLGPIKDFDPDNPPPGPDDHDPGDYIDNGEPTVEKPGRHPGKIEGSNHNDPDPLTSGPVIAATVPRFPVPLPAPYLSPSVPDSSGSLFYNVNLSSANAEIDQGYGAYRLTKNSNCRRSTVFLDLSAIKDPDGTTRTTLIFEETKSVWSNSTGASTSTKLRMVDASGFNGTGADLACPEPAAGDEQKLDFDYGSQTEYGPIRRLKFSSLVLKYIRVEVLGRVTSGPPTGDYVNPLAGG